MISSRRTSNDDFHVETRTPNNFHDEVELPPVGGRARRHSRGLIHQRSEAYSTGYFTDLEPTLDRYHIY